MRTLKRNKRPVAFAFYDGVQELTDEYGNYTGEYDVSYTEPVKTKMNVSGGRGGSKTILPAQPGLSVYQIVKGDNLTRIAKRFNTTVDYLFAINSTIKNKNDITAGYYMYVPTPIN